MIELFAILVFLIIWRLNAFIEKQTFKGIKPQKWANALYYAYMDSGAI
jgi:hypothetical protein